LSDGVADVLVFEIGLDAASECAVFLGDSGVARAIGDDGRIAQQGFEFLVARQGLFKCGPHDVHLQTASRLRLSTGALSRKRLVRVQGSTCWPRPRPFYDPSHTSSGTSRLALSCPRTSSCR